MTYSLTVNDRAVEVGGPALRPVLAVLRDSLPALLLIGLWAWYGRNTPKEHPKVTAQELAELGDAVPIAVARID